MRHENGMSGATMDIALDYRLHIGPVRNQARRIVGNAAWAEDIAQDVFLRLLEHRRRGKWENDTGAFLYRSVTNLALNRLRDRKRRRALIEAHTASLNGSSEPSDRLLIRQILGLVGKREAEVAVYYYIEELEQQEIAALLELPRRTVGRRLEAFRRRAEALLKDKDEGAPCVLNS